MNGRFGGFGDGGIDDLRHFQGDAIAVTEAVLGCVE
jgi:hypothetical protein